MQSSKAFKKILNAGRVESGSAFDENTLKIVQQMDKLTNEILNSLTTLENLSNGSIRFTAQIEDLREHLSMLITKHIDPILEYFK